jgi:hypothetical protein
MTVFAGTSGPNARRGALVSARRIGRLLTIGATLVLGAAATAHAEPAAATAGKADDAPVVQRGTAPGVDAIVVVPARMHHTLRATVDEHGKVEIEGRRGAAPVAPAPEPK